MKVNDLGSWRALEQDADRLRDERIETQFELDAARLDYLCLEAAGIYLDLSKHLVDRPVVAKLLNLARERKLGRAIDAIFAGEPVNLTEDRPALHTLLRASDSDTTDPAQARRASQIANVRRKMNDFAARINDGDLTGHDGATIRDVVNIGIGGSYLGPQLVCDALRYDRNPDINVHFVSNVDGGDLDGVLASLAPESTYFVVASKSFTTAETLLNARSASAWIQKRFNDPNATRAHFAAVTAAPDRAVEFGVDPDNVFPMWDWVGGRYSLWSAIGLPIAAGIGADGFGRLLAGARSMDEHFRTVAPERNLPVMLALIGIWNNNFLGCGTLAVAPYDDRLQRLPEYLQQLEMESNGKRITLDNEEAEYATAPVLWGGVGTNAQHAFFQQLHQGNRRTATDFILFLTHQRAPRAHHDMLIANCIGQAEGLMRGRLRARLTDIESPNAAVDLPAHRETPGNRPSTMIVAETLTPETLGALLALYEHKTFVQGVIWDIDSFDQWGVELGKNLANSILTELREASPASHDASTSALLERYRSVRKR